MIFKEFAKHFAHYIKPYWWQSSIVFAFMVLAIASSLAFPYILMILIDEVLPDEDYYLLGILLATLFGIIALNIISAFIANYLYRWVGNRVVFKMRSELFSHLLRLPLSFFKRNKTGDIAHRLNNDVQIVQKTLTSSVLKLVNSVLTLVSLGAVLIWLDAPLFLGLSLLVPCFIVNLKYFQPKSSCWMRRLQPWTRRARRSCCAGSRAKPTTRRSSSSAIGSVPSGRSMRLSAWTREKLSRKAPMPN